VTRLRGSGSSPPVGQVPDVLPGPGQDGFIIFCGINPGRVSAAAHAHFANPRNDFWRLLHDAGFTPRQLEPSEQDELLDYRLGVTNAALRTTPGSGDLRRADFDPARIERVARELRPRAIAFVGKEAYRGLFNERPELGPQGRLIGETALFVLPSTSPANAAVPFDERLRWFRALREWSESRERPAVRALLVDAGGRTLLCRWRSGRDEWWITPGGGVEPGESEEAALRRELLEETGLTDPELGPVVFERRTVLPYGPALTYQRERFYLVRVKGLDASPTIDLEPENVYGCRWWTTEELERTSERVSPPNLVELLGSVA
jgi:TDG/mug DNA glycosylase family protein